MTGQAEDQTLSASELTRMRTAARRGQVDQVSRWAQETYRRLGDSITGAAVAPRAVFDEIDELGETARAVDLARRGDEQGLVDWMQAIWLDDRNSQAERRQAILDRLDRIWDAASVAADGRLRRPPLEPDWARDGSDAAIQRLEITYRVRALLHQPRSHFVFEATPAMLTQIGDVTRIRIPRAPVASIRWLVGDILVNRITFLDAAGGLVGYWDVESYPSKRIYKWLCDLGFRAEKVSGREAESDPLAELPDQHV